MTFSQVSSTFESISTNLWKSPRPGEIQVFTFFWVDEEGILKCQGFLRPVHDNYCTVLHLLESSHISNNRWHKWPKDATLQNAIIQNIGFSYTWCHCYMFKRTTVLVCYSCHNKIPQLGSFGLVHILTGFAFHFWVVINFYIFWI